MAWLPPGIIIWDDIRITSRFREGEREALSLSITRKGQQAAIVVYLVDGQYLGSDGKNRCQDAMDKGEPLVRCEVHRGTAADVRLSNIATSLNRGHTNPLDVVETLWATHDQEGVEVEDLASAAGKSVEWVDKMLQIAQASPAVKQALGEELIALGHAELLSDLDSQEEQELALHKVLQEHWTVAELRDYLEGVDPAEGAAQRPSRRGPAVRNPQVCTLCHVEQTQGTIQTMHVCDRCAAKMGEPAPAGPNGSSAGGGGDLEGLMATAREAVPELRHARELLMRLPGSAPLAESLGGLATLLERGKAAADG